MAKYETIKQIEAMTEAQAQELNAERLQINGHNVYLADLEGYYGFSALVFRNGHHLYYADDYELHHKHMTHEELKKWYAESMTRKLFSDEMIAEPCRTYEENEAKDYYLRNYYPLMCDNKVSAFNIFHNDEEREAFEREVENMHYSRIGFFYSSDKAFIDCLNELFIIAQKSQEDAKNNREYWLNAFKYEMLNHEYAINWEADTDTLSAFGNIPRNVARDFYNNRAGLDDLFNALNFSDIQRSAYREAQAYVMNHSNL